VSITSTHARNRTFQPNSSTTICNASEELWRKTNKTRRKKRSEETQTLRAGCSKAEPKNFAPPQTPFPGARDGHNLISWRWSLPLPTNPNWRGLMHAISSYCGNRPTHTPTHRQDRLQHTAPQLASAQCKYLWPRWPTRYASLPAQRDEDCMWGRFRFVQKITARTRPKPEPASYDLVANCANSQRLSVNVKHRHAPCRLFEHYYSPPP